MEPVRLTRDELAACVLAYPHLRREWKRSHLLMGEYITAHQAEIIEAASGEVAPWGETGRLQSGGDGRPSVTIAICGHCGRGWNDALITSRSPVPSARCPFEYEHRYAAGDRDAGNLYAISRIVSPVHFGKPED